MNIGNTVRRFTVELIQTPVPLQNSKPPAAEPAPVAARPGKTGAVPRP